jgi:glucose/mannose-6-phosphate isomerase
MINRTEITRFDQKRLYGIYEDWPKYFRDALSFLSKPSYEQNEEFDSLVFCGMGGSATCSDILQQILDTFGLIPARTLRGEPLPSFVNDRSLVIVNSVSGNTSESLLMMKEALNRNAKVISISAGGKLKELSLKSKCQHIDIPDLSLPRASLPYLLIPGLMIIDRFLKKSFREEISHIPDAISSVLADISIDVPYEMNIAKKAANFLLDGLPFCYSSPSLLSSATRFKNSMNENAKIHCIIGSILEASHNDIVPFTFDYAMQTPKILLLRWDYDELMVIGRFEKVNSLFEKVVQPVMEIKIHEKNLLHALLAGVYILDLATIYTAISKDTDPSPTPAINILKDL